ncbi:unnamed protein product [Staurois parvus]|uniref:Uncharacterized protein n=1 Tax=Staurois parvus TaxID=386267 RepID=A0ABN9C993_9NEOB|nr:unnamed protein product [Staurois parvus]
MTGSSQHKQGMPATYSCKKKYKGSEQTRCGLTIWKLRHCPRARVSRGPHEMPLVPFS